MTELVHVAAAAIRNSAGQVFITRRPADTHQGDKLEFPGGKLETGESVLEALSRELDEELGIVIDADSPRCLPLIQITHHYSDKSVCLDVWEVWDYQGEPYGKEGQEARWMDLAELNAAEFPAANAPIIQALQLPRLLMVSPDLDMEADKIVAELIRRVDAHPLSHMILRLPRLSRADYAIVAERLRTERPQLCLYIHSDIDLAGRLGAGLHLSSHLLQTLDKDNLKGISSVSASIHSADQLEQAQTAGVQFVVLGAVCETATHPNADSLGWESFEEIARRAVVPVYAIGGLTQQDQLKVQRLGGQGVAGIRLFA